MSNEELIAVTLEMFGEVLHVIILGFTFGNVAALEGDILIFKDWHRQMVTAVRPWNETRKGVPPCSKWVPRSPRVNRDFSNEQTHSITMLRAGRQILKTVGVPDCPTHSKGDGRYVAKKPSRKELVSLLLCR